MPQFVREQDAEQGGRKGKAGEEASGIFVKKCKRAPQFIDGDGLVVHVGDGKLSSRDEARAKSKQEKHNSEDQRFPRRARRNLRVIPLTDQIVVPIEACGE